jgi:ketosteroid isomerase-like protein
MPETTLNQPGGLLTHPVLALEKQRCEALVRGDFGVLERIFSDSLTYIHSTGLVHDRAQCIAYMMTAVRFESMQRAALEVDHFGSLALCTGLMKISGSQTANGHSFSSVSFVTQAWTNHGTGWRLSLMQSTKVADSMWPEAKA